MAAGPTGSSSPSLSLQKLFWSLTIYDSDTRSEIVTDQGKAALRSLFELKAKIDAGAIDLYFGPNSPSGHEDESAPEVLVSFFWRLCRLLLGSG
jgi:hypothetical protein